MKKLIVAAFISLFVALPASAQLYSDVYRPSGSGAQIMAFDTTARTVTTAMTNRVVEMLCTAVCYIGINITGRSVPVTTATGIYLPANTFRRFRVSPQSSISVISTTTGNIHVLELAR